MTESGARRTMGGRLLAATLSLSLLATSIASAQPSLTDPTLRVTTVVTGLASPTTMAFLGPDDFLVLEKTTGKVKRVVNGVVTATVVDLPVNANSERGLLGIALHPDFPANPRVYLYWTESSTGADSTAVADVPLLGGRVDRFVWNATAQTLTLDLNVLRLRALQNDQNNPQNPAAFTPQGTNNGGKLAIGPDRKIYISVGDVGRRGWMQNLAGGPLLPPTVDDQFGGPSPDNAHLTGVILRLNLDGTTPTDNPFFGAGAAIGGEAGGNVQKLYSYGHRHGLGLAFDALSGNLWHSENGDDAFDEINKISAGGNFGWVQAMGPLSRTAQFKAIETNIFDPATASVGTLQQLRYPVTRVADSPAAAMGSLFMLPGAVYRDPELSWRYAVSPSALGFVRGNGLGAAYNGTLWAGEARTTDITGGSTGTFAGGALMVMRLTADRQHLDLSADPRLADHVADNGLADSPPPGTPQGTAGYKFDGRESESLLIGQGFGIVTDIQPAPDQSLYITSISANAVYRISRDPAPPVIVPQVVGTRRNDGVYTSNVIVSWSVTDPAFGIATSSGCGTTNLTADTTGTTLTCTATNGIALSSSVSVTIRIDQHFIDIPATTGTLGAIPDSPTPGVPGAPRDVTFSVTGMPHLGSIAVSMTFNPSHTRSGDVRATLIAPDGTAHVLFDRPGTTNDLSGPYVFRDTATFDFRAAAGAGTPVAAGTYRTSVASGLTAINPVLAAGRSGNGVWTLRFLDLAPGEVGTVSAATLSLAPSLITNLRVNSVVGNQVQLRWDAPAGFTPSSYLVEGGIVPGVVLAGFVTGLDAPIATFAAPAGSFWVRVRFLDGALQSLPSEDVPLFVGVPVPPSPPAGFTVTVAGTAVNMAWRNTFGGGAPTSILLDVTGAATASIPLGVTDQVAVAAVPGGTYHLSLRAVNAAGASPATSPITIAVPSVCSGIPDTPTNFLLYRVGNTVHLLWDPPATGPAPLAYRLDVTGSFVGSLPVSVRELSAVVPPGVYTVKVSAANLCGTSAPTANQTVTIP